MKHALLILALIFIYSCAYSQQVEDWIYFKDSTVVKGLVTEIKEGKVKIKTAEGIKEFRFYSIAEIVKHNPELMDLNRGTGEYRQTAKGMVKIGGSFSYSYVRYETSYSFIQDDIYHYQTIERKSTNFHLSPAVMYFLADDLGAGIIFDLSGISSGNSDTDYQAGAGINLQYYFASGLARPFVQVEGLYINIAEKGGFQYGGGLGFTFALSKNVGLQSMAEYGRRARAGSGSKEIFVYSLGLVYFLF